MSFMTILGIFVLTTFLLSQHSVDLQTSFAAKGGPGCGDNQKAIDASNGKCVQSVCDCDVVFCGACPDPNQEQ